MPDYRDLVAYVRGPLREKPFLAIWALPPNTAGVVGGIPDMIRYYFDVEERIRLEKELKDLLPEALILPGFWPSLGVVVEASAFGGKMVWSPRGAPHIFPAFRSIREADSIITPRPGEDGLTPLFMVQLEEMRRRLRTRGLEVDPLIKSMGPAEICGLLLGHENYYLSLYDEPVRLKRLMERVTEFIVQWLRLQEKFIGEPLLLQLAEHVPNQVRPDQMREFILPYLQAIYAEFPAPVKIYHNEGFHSDEHIGQVLQLGAEIWHFGSDVHDLAGLYEKVGDGVVPFGGVNPHGPIRHGTPDQVRAETRAVLNAARGKKLLLSTGTGTTPETTLKNVRAMVETAVG